MKKFFVAVCCVAFVGVNVSAQELTHEGQSAQSIVVADSDATLASSVQDAVATPAIPTAEAAPVVEAPALDSGMVSQSYEQTVTAAPVAADCGCGEAAPAFDYDGGASVVDGGASIVDGGCGCAEPAPCCCDSGKKREGLFSRLRARRASRNTNCCCN
jgi:hypothetical protein